MKNKIILLILLSLIFLSSIAVATPNIIYVTASTTNRSYNNTEVWTLSTTFVPILNITPPQNATGSIKVCFWVKEENTGFDSGQAVITKNDVQIGTVRETTGTYMQYCEDINTALNTTDTLSISARASIGVNKTYVKDMFLGYDGALQPGIALNGSVGGGAWINTTMNGMRARQYDGRAVMNFTIQDYLSRYEFGAGAGSAIYDENYTTNKGGTLFGSTWNATGGIDFNGITDYMYFPSGAQPYQNGDWSPQTYWTIGFRAMNRDTNATGANYALYLDARPLVLDLLFLRTSPASTMATRGYRAGTGNDKVGTYTWGISEIANWSIQSNRTNNITYVKNNSTVSSNHSVGIGDMHFNNFTIGAGYNYVNGARFAFGKMTIYDLFFFGRELNFSEMEEVSRKKIVTSGNMTILYGGNVSKIGVEAITSNSANYTLEYKNNSDPGNWTTLVTNWTGNSSFLLGQRYDTVSARLTCFTPNQSYNDCVVKAFYFTPDSNITSWMNTMTESNVTSGIVNQQFDNIKFNITLNSASTVQWWADGTLVKTDNDVVNSYYVKNWDTTGYKSVKANISGLSDTINVTWNVTINAQSPPDFNQTTFPYIDNFENMSEWSGSIYKTETHKVSGNYSARLEYSTTVASKTITTTNLSSYGSMNVSIYADNSQNTIYFRFGNATHNYQIPYYLNNSQWNNVTLHFSSAIVTGSPSWNNINTISVLSASGTGVIYLDEMSLNTRGAKLSLSDSIFGDYYGWYHILTDSGYYMKWNDNGHNPPLDIAMTLYPWYGVYDSTNVTEEYRKMRWFNESGIKIVAYEYWYTDSRTYVGLGTALNAANNYSLKVFMFLDGTPAPDVAVQQIQKIYDTYSGYPAYYRDSEYGNRPIINIYTAYLWPSDAWATNLSKIRGTKYDALIIGDGLNLTWASAGGFDAVGDYNSINDAVDISSFITYQNTHQKQYIATVSPGFNDTRIGRNHEVSRGSNASRYENYFRNMTYKYGASRLQIVSFNEEMEGSGIIPISPNDEISNETPQFKYFNFSAHPPTYFLDKTHQMIANYSGLSVPLLDYYGNNKTNNYTTNVFINSNENVSFSIISNRTSDIRWHIDNVLQSNNSNIPADTSDFYNISFATPGLRKIQVNASNGNGTTATMEWNVYVSQAGQAQIQLPEQIQVIII